MYAHRLTHAMEHWKKSSSKEKKAATKASKASSEGLSGPPGAPQLRPGTIASICALCCKGIDDINCEYRFTENTAVCELPAIKKEIQKKKPPSHGFRARAAICARTVLPHAPHQLRTC